MLTCTPPRILTIPVGPDTASHVQSILTTGTLQWGQGVTYKMVGGICHTDQGGTPHFMAMLRRGHQYHLVDGSRTGTRISTGQALKHGLVTLIMQPTHSSLEKVNAILDITTRNCVGVTSASSTPPRTHTDDSMHTYNPGDSTRTHGGTYTACLALCRTPSEL